MAVELVFMGLILVQLSMVSLYSCSLAGDPLGVTVKKECACSTYFCSISGRLRERSMRKSTPRKYLRCCRESIPTRESCRV
jgi:hypothetical protein